MIPMAIWSGTQMSIPQALLVAVIGIIVVLVELSLIALFIKILSKVINRFTNKEKADNTVNTVIPDSVNPGSPLPDTQSEGTIDLVDVDEPTAACIMAIVSNESGIPLNRLSFKSIKLLEDKQ